jgi:hypothetical protein
MAAMWCPKCGKFVSSDAPCAHLASNDSYVKIPVHASGGADAAGPGNAERPARDGDVSLEGARRIPDGLDAEHAEALITGGEHIHKQDAVITALCGALDAVVRRLRLSTVDLLGSLDLVKARVRKRAERQAREDDLE